MRLIRPGVQTLIDSWLLNPAYVQSSHLDILASNALARALTPTFEPGRNALHDVFLDPAAGRLFTNWHDVSRQAVAGIRRLAAPGTPAPALSRLVGELSLKSEPFRTAWARNDRVHRAGGVLLLDHPEMGDLELHYEKLGLHEQSESQLIVLRAQPGSQSEDSLRLLASLAASAV